MSSHHKHEAHVEGASATSSLPERTSGVVQTTAPSTQRKPPPRIAAARAPGPRASDRFALQASGSSLVALGVLGLVVTAFHVFTPEQPAVSLLLVIFGICCAYPSILTDGTDQVSSMRVSVLLIVSAFVLVAVRQAFMTTGEAKLDYGWVSIVLAALGAKAVQSIPESKSSTPSMGSTEYTGKNR